MDFFEVAQARRSIRKYTGQPLSREIVEQILRAGTLAPSAKNRQPWRFVVVQSPGAKAEMLAAMEAGILREEAGKGELPASAHYLAGARATMAVMEQAAVNIIALNPQSGEAELPADMEGQAYQLANAQSVGAAIQNMSLAATALGLGSLWNCDVYFARLEICRWLGMENQLVAALALGYSAQQPPPRPRKPLEEVTQWR